MENSKFDNFAKKCYNGEVVLQKGRLIRYMSKGKNKLTLKKLAGIVIVIIATLAILLLIGKIILNKKVQIIANQSQNNSANLNLAITKSNSPGVTSRSSSDVRNSSSKKQAKKKNSEKKSNVNEQKDGKSTKTNSSKSKKATTKTSKKSTTKYVSISQVKISRGMDLTKRTGLSRKDFIKLISSVRADTSGFFENNAGKIYDLCEEYSINEIFFCGLISAESGWNIASNHRRTHNYISLMRRGKLIPYSSVSEGLEVAAQKLHYNYLTPGGKFYHGKTIRGVKTCFCPSSSWVSLVYGRMRQII